jgi:VanZ family protein
MPPERTPGMPPETSRSARWLPPLLWTGLILLGTSWPSISVGPDTVVGLDKAMHFGVYGMLAVLVVRAVQPPISLTHALLILLTLSGFGAADEWHQGFIAGRSSSFYDWIADTLGILVGLWVSRYLLSPTPAGIRRRALASTTRTS